MLQISNIHFTSFKTDEKKYQTLFVDFANLSNFGITQISSLPFKLLSLLSIRPGESILTSLTGEDYDDLSPLSTSTLHSKPFLEINGRIYSFYHSGFGDQIPSIIENDLLSRRPDQASNTKKRSDALEKSSIELLNDILNPDFFFQSLYYPNPDPEGGITELDGLISVDDVLILIEAKAGGFSEGAKRAAPKSLEKDLMNLISEGQRQSERAEGYIKSSDEVAFYDETGKNEILKLKRSSYRQIFRVVITKEELGWVGAKIAQLSVMDPSLSRSLPWHISIEDLRVVSHLFKNNEIRFIHYLEQRLRAAAEDTLRQHDEIEHVGLYNELNAYHEPQLKGLNNMTFDASYMRDIDYYFSAKMVGENPDVPLQKLPSKFKEFMDSLKSSQIRGRFELGSAVLSMGGDARKDFDEILKNLVKAALQGRQLSYRMAFFENSFGLTISYADDTKIQEELKRSAVQMHQSNCNRWLVVQLINTNPISISQIELIAPGRFSDEQLRKAHAHLENKIAQKIKSEKIGRNDPCPCGNGKKYKRCHGR
jgi:hypothetical protein